MSPEHVSELDIQMLKLKEVLEQQGKVLGIDLDDTLTRTNQMFRRHIGIYLDTVLENLPNLREEHFRQRFEDANNEVFHRHGVNPNRWRQVVKILADEFNSPAERNILFQFQNHFVDIYTDIPELKPGAVEFLGALSKHGVPFIIITHANKDWTWHKINNTELGKYLNIDNVEIVSEDGHKDREAFLGVCANRSLKPRQIILIEDSLRSINAASQAGILDSVLITNPEGWGMYTEGETPEQTQVVESLLEIPSRLIEKLSGGGGI